MAVARWMILSSKAETARRPGARDHVPGRVAFRLSHSVGPRNEFPFAAQWLAYALPCRRFARVVADDATLGSGPMWIATPSSQWTCTTYSLPVSRRTRNEAKVELPIGASAPAGQKGATRAAATAPPHNG